jgi:hypothetical protein
MLILLCHQRHVHGLPKAGLVCNISGSSAKMCVLHVCVFVCLYQALLDTHNSNKDSFFELNPCFWSSQGQNNGE